MRNERWYISYRFIKKDFLFGETQKGYGSIVTDVSPARWVMLQENETHILYAEQISLAMASELIHCGTGIKADYHKEDDE